MRDRNLEQAELRIQTERLAQFFLSVGAIAGGRGDQSGMIMHLRLRGVTAQRPRHRLAGVSEIAVLEIDPGQNVRFQHIPSELALLRETQSFDQVAVMIGVKLRHQHVVMHSGREVSRMQGFHLLIKLFRFLVVPINCGEIAECCQRFMVRPGFENGLVIAGRAGKIVPCRRDAPGRE